MQKSNMSHSFSFVPATNIQRSVFNAPETYKSAFDAGQLIPFYCDEVVPGDTFSVKASMFARLATPIYPIMDNMYLDTFYFYVPNRILWDNWKAFMGEQEDVMDPVEYLVPVVNSTNLGFTTNSIFDYMGIPVGVPNLDVDALHLRAYNLIYNEWFRDQNLIEKVPNIRGDNDIESNYEILYRCKKHDYFTSCLPWPQAGEGIDIPITGDSLPVFGNGKALGLMGKASGTPSRYGLYKDSDPYTGNFTSEAFNTNAGDQITEDIYKPDQNTSVGLISKALLDSGSYDYSASGVYADMTEAVYSSVNELRLAMQMQRMLERDARGGHRYVEIVRSHFGVVSPDGRQQRPEFLGGSTTRINVYPVQQTSESSANSKLGSLAAFGVMTDTNGFNKSFTEHGVLIGICSVRADLTYSQGLHKMWSRQTKYDFLWPSLANIGEQAVLNREIYAQGNNVLNAEASPVDEDVFGYQERYGEYRYGFSKITGVMRPTVTAGNASLAAWHLSEKFDNLPALNQAFITDNTASVIDRAIAVSGQPQILFDCFLEKKMARPLPTFSVPGLMDHF